MGSVENPESCMQEPRADTASPLPDGTQDSGASNPSTTLTRPGILLRRDFNSTLFGDDMGHHQLGVHCPRTPRLSCVSLCEALNLRCAQATDGIWDTIDPVQSGTPRDVDLPYDSWQSVPAADLLRIAHIVRLNNPVLPRHSCSSNLVGNPAVVLRCRLDRWTRGSTPMKL